MEVIFSCDMSRPEDVSAEAFLFLFLTGKFKAMRWLLHSRFTRRVAATAPQAVGTGRDCVSFSKSSVGPNLGDRFPDGNNNICNRSITIDGNGFQLPHRFIKYGINTQKIARTENVTNPSSIRPTHSRISPRSSSRTPRTDPHPPSCAESSGQRSPSA